MPPPPINFLQLEMPQSLPLKSGPDFEGSGRSPHAGSDTGGRLEITVACPSRAERSAAVTAPREHRRREPQTRRRERTPAALLSKL